MTGTPSGGDKSLDARIHAWPSESPYGAWGEQLGLTAWWTIQDLTEATEPEQNTTRSWSAADHASFNGCFAVIFRTHTQAHLKPPLEPHDERRWMESLESFHLSLPYSESERIWIACRNEGIASYVFANRNDGRLASAVAEDELELHSSGVYVTHNGQALVNRWWDWRRQAGQFENQRSVDEARLALSSFVTMLTPRLTEHDS